ncbi:MULTISPECIES: sodium-dependent transporter [Bacteroidales]|uniref:Transporter n=1 Tax=Xylanibacter muris TaxID=2736290 RepID=A0ABX2AQ78_9BACT|nr:MULTISPECIES: sodium-dependent transporter [Bacteroidales]NPD92182.1 sodium-dependent transporter [Xylanibacter muris]
MSLQERAKFGSKIGVILATAGSAVGLGNVWRFPYMTGENGGAAFIICYVFCIVVLGLPCMISEFVIGRNARSNTARAYHKLGGRSPWMVIGYLGVLTGFLITGYYAVVSGWCLQYIYASVSGCLHGNPQFIRDYFVSFETDPLKPILCTIIILAITHMIISRGVKRGIEKASKMMMPTLFVLLLFIVIMSCMLPGAGRGISFLLKPDFDKMNSDVLLGALGQSFYSLSIGMGCLCTYASYFSKETNLAGSAVKIGVIDSLVAILAGLMIFPAAFSVGVEPDSGPSLIFITLPNVFHQAFSSVPAVGDAVAVMFYALLSLAALTSLISLHEVSTAFLSEELKISRSRGALIVTVLCTAVGVFCSLSIGGYEGLQLFGRSLFDVFDFVTGQVFLPVVGFLTCIFVGWFLPGQLVRDEFTNYGTLKGSFYRLYIFSVKIVCPVCIVLIFLHQFGVI